jgi:hypothetical protein
MSFGAKLLLPWLVLAAALLPEDETVRDFRRLFRKFKERGDRVEAVASLDRIEAPEVVSALAPVIVDEDPEVQRQAIEVLSHLRSDEALGALEAAFAGSKAGPERLAWLQVYELSRQPLGEAGRETLFETLEARDWPLRWRAARVLAALAPEGAEAALIAARADSELAVRCAALEGLGALRTESAVDQALAALAAADWQERASAIEVLAQLRRKRSIGPLIERLAVEEGRLRADLGAALERITARGFGARLELWQNFWRLNAERFEVPTEEELAQRQRAEAEANAQYETPKTVAYHGVETPSLRILFVLDVSGSMANLVIDRERFQGQDYRSWSRMDVVARELQRAIEGLQDHVQFNILTFARDLRPWRSKPVSANLLQKQAAIEWLGGLEPVGGIEDQELAAAGLTGSADLEAGRTNSYAALMFALGLVDESGRAKRQTEYQLPVDTVFFLSDGEPSVGEYIDPDDILREVRRANELRKVVLHTFALGQFRKSFMERLASENGGRFVDLGR